jgi:hypothetical protein
VPREVHGLLSAPASPAGASLSTFADRFIPRRIAKQTQVVQTEAGNGAVAKQFSFSYLPDKRISGCLCAIVRSFKVASRGWRTPCSQLSTALGLTLMIRAKTAWLALKDCLMARIWVAVSGFGGGGTSVTRYAPFLPCS